MAENKERPQNKHLVKFTSETASEMGRRGQKKAQEVIKAKKLFQDILIETTTKLEGKGQTEKEEIAKKLIEKAKQGDLIAIEMFVSYIGEKPEDVMKLKGDKENPLQTNITVQFTKSASK